MKENESTFPKIRNPMPQKQAHATVHSSVRVQQLKKR